MNTDRLAPYYGELTPRERVPLIIAARARGDDMEAERLLQSSPRNDFSVATHNGVSQALNELASMHMVRVLDATAQMWRFDALYQLHLKGRKADKDRTMRLVWGLQRSATMLLLFKEAWARFCDELHMDRDVLLRDVPGYDTVTESEPIARTLQLGPEEVSSGPWPTYDGDPLTVESILADYRAVLDMKEAEWA